jgi:hypothetical protein
MSLATAYPVKVVCPVLDSAPSRDDWQEPGGEEQGRRDAIERVAAAWPT